MLTEAMETIGKLREAKLRLKEYKDQVLVQCENDPKYQQTKNDLDEVRARMKAIQETALEATGLTADIETTKAEVKELQEELNTVMAAALAGGQVQNGVELEVDGMVVIPTFKISLRQMRLL